MRKVYHILGVCLASILVLIFTVSLSSYLIKILSGALHTQNIALSKIDEFLIKKNEKPNLPKPVKILFLGDMMFDRGVRSQINSKGFDYVFGPSAEMFAKYDKVIANLEGPISSFESKTLLPGNKAIPGFQFTFPIETSDALKEVGIDMVSLANNHTYNFGADGLAQTRTRLINSDVQYFGSPENNMSISTSTCVSIMTESGKVFLDSNNIEKKICVGLIGWHEFGTKNYQKVLNEISAMRSNVDYLIVFPHWGVEYEKSPTVTQIGLAHEWLNAGADAVIGAHPHVVQKIERYKTKDGRIAPVFYSLGNFIFDQYFSFDTTHGIAVEVTFASSTLATSVGATSTSIAESATYKILPVESIGSRVSIPDASSTARMITDIEHVSGKNLFEWLEI